MSPLGWLLTIEIGGLVACLKYAAPAWMITVFGVLIAVTVIVYIGGYSYFAYTNPESLRTEKYSLDKMAIERSVRGDNLSGIVDSPPQLGAGTTPIATLPAPGESGA